MQPTTKYKVSEIFHSIEGEGKRAGIGATFIRLAGCNLRCTYCDTTYALTESESTQMSLDEIMTKVRAAKTTRVTLTGGEPLISPGVQTLIDRLLQAGYEVNVETNGSVDVCVGADENIFFTMDYKLPSSGQTHMMLKENFARLRSWDVLKFVVGSEDDVAHMINALPTLLPQDSKPFIYIGAVHNGYPLQDLVKIILSTPILKDARLQLQFHKIIWDASQRGV